MSEKAILIIDKPERSCVMCPCYELESGTCQALPNDDPLDHYDINDNRIIPKDCPLKPLPHLTDHSQAEDMRAKHSSMYDLNNTKNALVRFIDGWESCLDEIEGKGR